MLLVPGFSITRNKTLHSSFDPFQSRQSARMSVSKIGSKDLDSDAAGSHHPDNQDHMKYKDISLDPFISKAISHKLNTLIFVQKE